MSTSHPRSFHAPQVVALGALKLLDDLPALSDEAPRFLSAGEQERAEPELVAQPPGSYQIPIRDQTPNRERDEEGEGPAETGRPSDERRLERPEERECDDAREEPGRRVIRRSARPRRTRREVELRSSAMIGPPAAAPPVCSRRERTAASRSR